MDKDTLAEIIREHTKWLLGEGGSRADLSGVDLSDANLSGVDLSDANLSGVDLSYADLSRAELSGVDLSRADLSRADLSYANLHRADLHYADLHYTDLSYADLSDADLSYANLRRAGLHYADLRQANLKDTILADINWLAYIGIVPNKSGTAYAYKVTKANGEGIKYSGIHYADGKHFEVEKVDDNVNVQCSFGINLATFPWCLNAFTDKTYRLFMFKFNVRDAICPVGSDGKFRVKQCDKVGECDWHGNLKEV